MRKTWNFQSKELLKLDMSEEPLHVSLSIKLNLGCYLAGSQVLKVEYFHGNLNNCIFLSITRGWDWYHSNHELIAPGYLFWLA